MATEAGQGVLGGIWWEGEVLPEILGGPPGGSWDGPGVVSENGPENSQICLARVEGSQKLWRTPNASQDGGTFSKFGVWLV